MWGLRGLGHGSSVVSLAREECWQTRNAVVLYVPVHLASLAGKLGNRSGLGNSSRCVVFAKYMS